MYVDVNNNFIDAEYFKNSDTYMLRDGDYLEGVMDRIYNQVLTDNHDDIEYDVNNVLDWKHFFHCTALINISASRIPSNRKRGSNGRSCRKL